MVWCLSLRKQRAASCRSARPGCANGKGLRGDPERNEIDGSGHFVFDLGGSPLERAEGLAPKPCEAGAGRVRGLMCACARDCDPEGRDARFSGSGSAASKARPRPPAGTRRSDARIHMAKTHSFAVTGPFPLCARSFPITVVHRTPRGRGNWLSAFGTRPDLVEE